MRIEVTEKPDMFFLDRKTAITPFSTSAGNIAWGKIIFDKEVSYDENGNLIIPYDDTTQSFFTIQFIEHNTFEWKGKEYHLGWTKEGDSLKLYE